MKKITTSIIAVALAFTCVACGGSTKENKDAQKDSTETAVSTAMEVDDVLAQADSLLNKEVTLQGVCTHACKHGATKIFLMGSDDTKTIRVQAGDFGAFDTKCVSSIVEVTGKLMENRIDEAAIVKMEEAYKSSTAKQHGDSKAGCDSEKKALGVEGNTFEEKMADMRAKIASNKEKYGKEYISDYYVVATKYEIK